MGLGAIDPRDVAERIKRRRAFIARGIRERAAAAMADPAWPPRARLFLFGSRARGDAVAGSDVDLLVFGARDPSERAVIEMLLRQRLSAWPLDILFFDDLEDLGAMGRSVLAGAIELGPAANQPPIFEQASLSNPGRPAPVVT